MMKYSSLLLFNLLSNKVLMARCSRESVTVPIMLDILSSSFACVCRIYMSAEAAVESRTSVCRIKCHIGAPYSCCCLVQCKLTKANVDQRKPVRSEWVSAGQCYCMYRKNVPIFMYNPDWVLKRSGPGLTCNICRLCHCWILSDLVL